MQQVLRSSMDDKQHIRFHNSVFYITKPDMNHFKPILNLSLYQRKWTIVLHLMKIPVRTEFQLPSNVPFKIQNFRLYYLTTFSQEEGNFLEGKIEGRIEVTKTRGRRSKQLLDLKQKTGYWKFKEEALDRTVRRTRFGIGCGPVVRQTVDWG